MTYKDIISVYENKKKIYKKDTYKYISKLLKDIKEIHRQDALSRGITDTEQSWRAFKGKNLEKLIEHIIKDEIEKLNLSIINGNILEHNKYIDNNELDLLKRNLAIDYGEFGMHLPDVDIIIYEPNKSKIIAVLSVKVTLRERIAQTGYWKLKLMNSNITKDIKVFFITLDEDDIFSKKPAKKGRAIVEVDTDGCYILTENEFEKSSKVKLFSEFINDLKKLK
mgnify:FL=1